MPYDRISPHLKRAIIAAEDAKFVDHEGFDWEGIQKALENQKKGGPSLAARPLLSNWPRISSSVRRNPTGARPRRRSSP